MVKRLPNGVPEAWADDEDKMVAKLRAHGALYYTPCDLRANPPVSAKPFTDQPVECDRCHKMFVPTPTETFEYEVIGWDNGDVVGSYAYVCLSCQSADPDFVDEM